MSDLKIVQTTDGGEITVTNGKPEMTDALDNALYLSLFTREWWGNDTSEQAERYNSTLPDILDRPLTAETRLDAIAACRGALQWMVDDGIAERIEVEAEIPQRGQLSILIQIYEPDTEEPTPYTVNWRAQEAAL